MSKPKFQSRSPVDVIKRIVAREYKVPPSKMVASQRPRRWAWPRQVAMALTRELTSLSSQETARQFGFRDHGTVMHAEGLVFAVSSMAKNGEKGRINALREKIVRTLHNAV